ncbi:MAG: AMP-binding protein [Caulobacterales bacterium]
MWVYPEIRTLGDIPNYYRRHDPKRRALVQGSRTVDFETFDRITNQVAHAIVARGAARGERVGFLGKNTLDFYFAMFGVSKTQSCFTVFNWRLSPTELAEQVADSATRLVIVERDLLELWGAARDIAKLEIEEVLIDSENSLEVAVQSFPDERPSAFVSEEDTAIQLYTSGTTGRAKGVMLSHGGFNRIRLCEHFEPAYDWRDGDCFINPLPNFHLLHIGIAIQCLYNGVAVSVVRQFDPPLILEAIARERPTLLTLTPTMIQLLLDHPAAAATDFSSLRLMLYAGSPISLGLITRAIGMMPCKFMQFYGATEANGAFSILRPDEHDLSNERKLQSCGRPLPLIEFRIVDADGNELPDGEPGELLVRSPAITPGYWGQPEMTAAVLSNGWYRSGDIASRDSDGLYYIVDRAKDMIVSGGENIYSSEVENVLSTHPAVAAVAVIGVPDARWGEAVKAIIIKKAGVEVSSDDLDGFCRGRLAAYKSPKSYDFVDAFPYVPSGKVSKKDLRAKYWQDVGRNVG